ncbi:MAG: hypothetical protein H0X31_00080 [Nostocaceae cyanobacterium]|nr:hypothetical protein [Nostocaceae cyanobacterium]
MNDLELMRHLVAVHWHLEILQYLPQIQANHQLLLACKRAKSVIEAEAIIKETSNKKD